MAGCKKCIFFKICFLKGIIGDYKKEEEKKKDEKKP